MQVTTKEVLKIVNDLPNGNSSGFDGQNSERLKHADPLLCLLLSICFTCMFTHSYMPSAMIKSIIVPLVKNKCGSLAENLTIGQLLHFESIISKGFFPRVFLKGFSQGFFPRVFPKGFSQGLPYQQEYNSRHLVLLITSFVMISVEQSIQRLVCLSMLYRIIK